MGQPSGIHVWLAAPLALLYRAWSATWRFSFEGRELMAEAVPQGAVLALWHGEQLALAVAHRGLGAIPMVSQSRDGELLAGVLSRLGFELVRGSSSRGGALALQQQLAALQAGRSPILAIDGPRGPRHHPRPGAVVLAQRAGRPVIYAVAIARPVIRLGSWDRFEIPWPFARIHVRYGRIDVSPAEPVEAAVARLQDGLAALAMGSRPP